MSDYNLLIDGQMVPGDLTMPVLNPATEEVLVQCPRASNGQLDKAVAAAKAAYPAWAATPNSPSMPPIRPRRPGVCRRHERQAALRARCAGRMVEQRFGAKRRHDPAGPHHCLRSPHVRLLASRRWRKSQSVSCFCPHSLQANLTRVAPLSADSRLGAPHLPQTASIRVFPCLTTRFFFSIVSRISRSASSRIDCFDIGSPPTRSAQQPYWSRRLGRQGQQASQQRERGLGGRIG